MHHITLLGDSIMDNAPYVPPGQTVTDHLQAQLGEGERVTLAAVDGSLISGVQGQLLRVPRDATHLVVSVGGNDALRHQEILTARATSFSQVLEAMAEIGQDFEQRYRQMVNEVLQLQKPTVFCTIYYPAFPDPIVQRLAVAASTIFNDAILRSAFLVGAPIIDLRLVCNEEGDYANPIEPSSAGGRKIAAAVQRATTEHDFSRGRTEVFI